MARRARAEEIEETDRIGDFAHPRETFRLIGQDRALARAARAIRSGRPPPGWLIGGPSGVGKATLAYRIARYLLRYGATDAGPEDLSVPDSDPVSRLVRAGSHPGLLKLTRGVNPNTGKPMTVLAVNIVREISEFFSLTSAIGGWRIAIIDSADEMNQNAANALLKNLEEPPARAMLMLISNAPGRLLPTIRSRCQRLDLNPLTHADLAAGLATHLPQLSQHERDELADLSGGSMGAALALASSGGLALARSASEAVDHAAAPDISALLALADRIGRKSDVLAQFGTLLERAIESRIRDRARVETGSERRRWIEAWEQVRANFECTQALHLEPKQTILSSAGAIACAARHSLS